MLKLFVRAFGLVIAAILALSAFSQQKAHARDEFFWLGQMNKATAVINTWYRRYGCSSNESICKFQCALSVQALSRCGYAISGA